MGKEFEYIFLHIRYINGQQALQMMINITSHQESAKQNPNEALLHTHEYGYNLKKR